MSKTIKISNCVDCVHHEIRPDPDPSDWFCDDDVKVVCTKTKSEKVISSGNRPYEVRNTVISLSGAHLQT